MLATPKKTHTHSKKTIKQLIAIKIINVSGNCKAVTKILRKPAFNAIYHKHLLLQQVSLDILPGV